MGCIGTDLTIETVLADPMIGALMRADGVDPQRYGAWLRSRARSLRPAGREAAAQAQAADLRPARGDGVPAW